MYDYFVLLVILSIATMVDEAIGIIAVLLAVQMIAVVPLSGNGVVWIAYAIFALALASIKHAIIPERERGN